MANLQNLTHTTSGFVFQGPRLGQLRNITPYYRLCGKIRLGEPNLEQPIRDVLKRINTLESKVVLRDFKDL